LKIAEQLRSEAQKKARAYVRGESSIKSVADAAGKAWYRR
jgi:hypothetical protein